MSSSRTSSSSPAAAPLGRLFAASPCPIWVLGETTHTLIMTAWR